MADSSLEEAIRRVLADTQNLPPAFLNYLIQHALLNPLQKGVDIAPAFSATGLTGSTAPSRYVGATSSGAPASGYHLKGDFVIDQTGAVWVCTTKGSPGTWTKAGGSGVSSPLTTKGDVWGYSTVDARIPIGADGNVLTADSTQALGLKWAAAAAGGGAVTQIANTVLGADAATINFSSISSSYNHLLFVYALRSKVTGENVAATSLRFNGDTGANYSYQHIWGNTTSSNAGNSSGQTNMQVLFETGPNATANQYGMGFGFIPYYATGTMLRSAISAGILSPSGPFAGVIGGTWSSTTAINRVTFYASDLTSNLAAGSGVTLYGIT